MRYATTLQQATCICPWGQRIWVCVSLFLSVIINHTPIYIHKYLYPKRKLPSTLSDPTLSQWILMAAKHNLVLLKTQREFWIHKYRNYGPDIEMLTTWGFWGHLEIVDVFNFKHLATVFNGYTGKWVTLYRSFMRLSSFPQALKKYPRGMSLSGNESGKEKNV